MKNVVMGVRIKTRDMQNVVKANFVEGVAETKAKQKIKFSFCSTSIVGNKDYTIEFNMRALDHKKHPESVLIPDLLLKGDIEKITAIAFDIEAASIFKLEDVCEISFMVSNEIDDIKKIEMDPRDIEIAKFLNKKIKNV